VHISRPVTWLVGHEWVPTSVKMWWYSEPPAVNDLRVGAWIGIIVGGVIVMLVF